MKYLKNWLRWLEIRFNSIGLETDFHELKDPVAFLDSITKCEMPIEKARPKKEDLSKYLKKIRIGNRSEKKALSNINKLFNVRNDAFKFVDDYGSMILQAKRKAAEQRTWTRTIKSKNET